MRFTTPLSTWAAAVLCRQRCFSCFFTELVLSFKRQHKGSLQEAFLHGPQPAVHTPLLGSLSTREYATLELATLDSAPKVSGSGASCRTLGEQATLLLLNLWAPSGALQLLME